MFDVYRFVSSSRTHPPDAMHVHDGKNTRPDGHSSWQCVSQPLRSRRGDSPPPSPSHHHHHKHHKPPPSPPPPCYHHTTSTYPAAATVTTHRRLVALSALTFWLLVLFGTYANVSITLDGSPSTISALNLASCASCALRPDRLLHMLRTLTEHSCIKRRLERFLRKQFDRLCLLPNQINKCFDWDLTGTRWQRIGLSLSATSTSASTHASTKEVKKAFHKTALANHPDKVTAPMGAAEAEEAATKFMKAQKAFEKIMEAKGERKPPSMAAQDPPSQPAYSSRRGRGGARGRG